MNKPELILSPTDFVAIANQALEHVFGAVRIEGELANFRISKNKWVYFDIKDEASKVACFASIYALPGPLEEGLLVRIVGQPKLHPQFGFSITVQSIQPSGEGAIKKAYELLKVKLTLEGLFEPSRKRLLPYPPQLVALVTSLESAAYADFIKILNVRWPFVELQVYDVQVQGEPAPQQLTSAIARANSESKLADVLVIIRGGGGADDLAAFNDERVVRAVASSRIPTLVAIGHEIDESLCELAADKRASTPSNAAELIAPDRSAELRQLAHQKVGLLQQIKTVFSLEQARLKDMRKQLTARLNIIQEYAEQSLDAAKQIFKAYNPQNILKRGYALVKSGGSFVKSIDDIKAGNNIDVNLYDGQLNAVIKMVKSNNREEKSERL